ncbi:hypothetical protein BDV40DRAFT_294172 [Aspergillus tamarii]|uniref:Uncharacterized protein n=1 Tax=Aspergillus tamarii TaxID=41984 RepID=A0A5N6UAP4_ASPTM|nr:hypothetical protein BDV40DRAFT_294172 [Aspergillus tamarii]
MKFQSRKLCFPICAWKGRILHCAMDGDQEAANYAIPAAPISPWTDYGDLIRYGWKLGGSRDPDETMAQDLLQDIFEELNIDADQNKMIKIDQSLPVTVDNKNYEVGSLPILDYGYHLLTTFRNLEQNIRVCSMQMLD